MTSTLNARAQVVFATDLQSHSRVLLEIVRDFASASGAQVNLVHAVRPRSGFGLSRATRRDLHERDKAEAERALSLQVDELVRAGVEVGEPVLTSDEPAHRAILTTVETLTAELVIVGATARTTQGPRVGSTADRVVRASPVPVLVLRGRPSVPFTSVTFLTDFSARSRRGHVAGARFLPMAEGATIELLHAGDVTLRVLDPTYKERTVAETDDEARRLEDTLGLSDGRIRSRVIWGRDPLDVLVPPLSSNGCDLLVLGTHGFGPIRRALIGSVAMGLTQIAPCSVMIVP